MQDEAKEITFVTKKALVAFSPHRQPAISLNGTVIFIPAAIIEYEQRENQDALEKPSTFFIVGLTNGKKLTKRIRVSVPYDSLNSVVELDDVDICAINSAA